ncbi:hypothetical protein CDL12_05341 [Handroanthus impetiginosus]|uniref:Uncharacterized protein n=1 Tax=Handroanthus impetiginosus TaxID=429701 RepID=A0A2G9HWQ4_9LAMI|nr:hypothetical protein CDL12_05341 [Handroanthus impetiginosus]
MVTVQDERKFKKKRKKIEDTTRAIIMVIISFWRIRALLSRLFLKLKKHGNSQGTALTSSSLAKVALVEAVELGTTSILAETKQYLLSASTTSYYVSKSNGCLKLKFSLYYNECEFVENDDRDKKEYSVAKMERIIMVRMGDMGWYKCQDLMTLNESVVRLWDSHML